MLKSLYIKNYALIDSLEIDFTPGFSVITGETGAGKSIILGALSLILGQRADMKSIKQGEDKCIIEGVFDVSAYDLKSFSEEKNIEYDGDSYILRREIFSNGKSRGFINDSPANLNDLKELGSRLIDIHSQHQNLLLVDNLFQMQVVDALANTSVLLKDYKQAFGQYKRLEKELAEVKETMRKSKEEEDYINFQHEALNQAALVDGEQEELETEQDTLSHGEEIQAALYKCFLLLSDDEQGVVIRLKESLSVAQSLRKIFAKAESISERIESAYIDIQDLALELEKWAEHVEFSPERLTKVNSRLDIIYSLQTKHKVSSIIELITLKNNLAMQLEAIDLSDIQLARLEKELTEQHTLMLAFGAKLSTQRRGATKKIERNLIEKISVLGMPNVRFECQIKDKKEPDSTGIDDLEFLFSANKNVHLQPVSEIASGGEISRFMLCIKSMIAGATALPSIIFDEIDTGVSGEIADKMGVIMQEFGQKMQVITITHLPQIAAKGKTHYRVYKSDENDTTTTNLIRLSDSERLEEVARMLSGAVLTDAAISNAKEMLELK